MAKTININGLRIQLYESTYTDSGSEVRNVWMDQYGRILKQKRIKGGKIDFVPTGRAGRANH